MQNRMKNNPVSMADLGAKMSSQESIAIAGLSISLPLPFLQQGFDATLEQFKNTLAPLLDLSKSQFNNQVSTMHFGLALKYPVVYSLS